MITKKNEDNHWMSISDLMSGLMIIFLLISISYMLNVLDGQKRVRNIAVTYHETQVLLYDILMEEFKNDLPKWGAEIEQKTLSVRFLEPDVLFKTNESEVTNKFRIILQDFFQGI